MPPCVEPGIQAFAPVNTELAADQVDVHSLEAVLLLAGTFNKVRVAFKAPSAFNQNDGLLSILAGVTEAKLGVKMYLIPLPAPGKTVLLL